MRPGPLLFIQNKEPQIIKTHILLQQPVGSDDDIDPAGFHPRNDLKLFFFGAEAAQAFHLNRETFKSGFKSDIMLLGQHGGGYQHGYLLGFTDR